MTNLMPTNEVLNRVESHGESGLACWVEDFDADGYATGEKERERPTLLRRRDLVALLYAGHVNELHGEPEGGKGFIAGVACAEVLREGGSVLYLDFDMDPESVVERVVAGGANAEELSRLHIRPIDGPLPIEKHNGMRQWGSLGAQVIEDMLSIEGLALLVVDGVNNALAMHGLSAMDLSDYADFNRLTSFRFRKAGITVLLIDHVTKSGEGRRYAIGTQQKITVLDGASYEVRIREQPAPGRVGKLELVVAKDRRGAVRAASRRGRDGVDVAAEVEIDGRDDTVTVEVKAPALDGASFQPTFYMEQVSIHLETCDEPASKNAIAAAVGRKKKHVLEAVDCLVQERFVVPTPGPRKGTPLYASAKPYRQPVGEDG